MILQLPISLVEDGDVYIAVCPVFHIKSKGKSMEEAIKNIKIDLEKFLDNGKVQKEYENVIKDYGIRDIEIIDIVVNPKLG